MPLRSHTRRAFVQGAAVLGSAALVGTGIRAEDEKTSEFAKTFLTAEDLPGMKLREDHRDAGAPPGDESFKKLGGVNYGLVVWIPEEEGKSKIDRMVEIHFVFPDADSAQKYLSENIKMLAESMPQIKNAPKVGDPTVVVGGLQTHPFLADHKFYSYIFLYRVDRTLIKLYAYQDGAERKLQPLGVFPIAKKIADRVAKK